VVGGILILASIFILWCCYRRQSTLRPHIQSPDVRSSFDATAGLITDNPRDTIISMYDEKFTSPVIPEKGSLAARLGRTRGPISATRSIAVNSEYSTSGGVETKVPSGFGASMDPTAGALVLRVPESLKLSGPDNSKKGGFPRAGTDKMGTPTRSEPRWSSSSQIAHTRPITPASSVPSLPSLPGLPSPSTIPFPALQAAARRRTMSSGNASGSHYVRVSERLTAAAQENARDKDKEPSRKISVSSSLSNLTKARISTPILQPHAPLKIEIVNAFLRNSPTSDSFAEDGGADVSSRRSADSGVLGIDEWSVPSSSGATDGMATRPESDINVNSAIPSTVNPFAEIDLKVLEMVSNGGLEVMDREKEAGRGWSGGSLIDGVEWPNPPT
jgi:hypothetical protein